MPPLCLNIGNELRSPPHPKQVDDASKNKSPSQLNKEIQKGQAPRGIERIDKGSKSVKGEQTHVHFKDGTALNIDGTWKDGNGMLNQAQKEWLSKNGWNI